LILGLLAILLTQVGCRARRTAFSVATLVSNAPPLQFDEASEPAFSQNGEYVAFRGSLAGVPGVYRRDLRTGQVALVAGGSAETELNAPDASAPSISADGRYIAFTSAHVLDAADDTGSGCPQVYVRDMDVPMIADGRVEEAERQAAAKGMPAPAGKPFTLASALNGSAEGLTYAQPCSARSGGELVLAGSQAAPGVAISADGQEVAFTVLSASDLSAPCTGAPVKCPTEPSQVAVRNLQADTTTLVSVTPEGDPAPGGGAFPANGVDGNHNEGGSSAAISADGSTVAWQGTNVPAQVPSATDVEAGMGPFGGPSREVEPLWRRVADGSAAVTKRLLAGAHLNFYFEPSHESPSVVEGGALAPVQQAFAPPALSADGHTVAVISNAPTATNEGTYVFLNNALPTADAYVAQVGEGSTAQVNVTALTATPNFAAPKATNQGVASIAISPDGTRVAFNTSRVSFALAPPTLISPPAPETTKSYTYEANLPLGTLQRVTNTYDGAPPDGSPGQISFAGDGLALSFASTAANLFYGDAAPGSSQVYLTEEQGSVEQPLPQSISGAPRGPVPLQEWLLSVTAAPQRDGSVVLYAEVPGAGRLAASALAQMPSRRAAAGQRHARRRHGASGARLRGVVDRARSPIATNTVAQAATFAADASQVQLRLRLKPAYRALPARRGGLYAVLSVSFNAPSHPRLVQQIPVSFRLPKARRTRAQGARRGGNSNGNRTGHKRGIEQ
jgi:hypothetical protein